MYPCAHTDDNSSDFNVSESTIKLLCDHQNENIILNPMATMEDMDPHKQRRTILGNARLPLL